MTNFAIDTNVLINAFDNYEQTHLFVVTTISGLNHSVCFDFDGIIENEYEKNLRKNRMYRKWYQALSQRSGFYRCNGHLFNQHKKALIELLCHEPTDQTFVGVAFHSDKILISEDSDLGKGEKGSGNLHAKALKYLQDEMKIKVFDAEEARLFFVKFK